MTFRGPQKLEQWPSRDGPFAAVRRFAPAPARVEGGDGHDLPGTSEHRAVALPEHPLHRRASLRSRYSAGRGRRRTRPSPSACSSGRTRWTAPSLERSRLCPPEPGVLAAATARTPGVRRTRLWSLHPRPGAPVPGPAGWRPLEPGGPEGARAGRSVREAGPRHLMLVGHGQAHHGRGVLRPWSRHYGEVVCGWGLGSLRPPPGLRHLKPGGPGGDAT